MAAGVRLPNRSLVDCIVGTGIFIGKGQMIIDFTGLFVTGNTFDVTINAIPLVQVPFNTDHNTTVRDIATAINARADAVAYVITESSTLHRIAVEGQNNGDNMVFTPPVIAGGASQPVANLSPKDSGSYQEQAAIAIYTLFP